MKPFVQNVFELTKFKITSFSAFSTAVGYFLAADRITLHIFAPAGGILLLAMGSAVLNQLQERQWDARMARTRQRPLPAGKVTPGQALAMAGGLVLSGGVLLYLTDSLLALFLGLLALAWYNGIYTPLKRVTPFAVVPGALIGAIPPAAGWVAAGGALQDPRILALSFFFFIWQVPHFWLLLLLYGRDYERAGFPSLTSLFERQQLERITFVWMFATAVACLLIPFLGGIQHPGINAGMVLSAAWLMFQSFRLVGFGRRISFGFAFRDINLVALAVLVLISIDKLIRIL